MSLDHSQTPEEYLKHLPKVRPQLPVQKYKLDDSAFSRWSATDGTSYLYQRLRVPSDHRYAVAYGKIEPEKYIDWFFYYEEIIINLKVLESLEKNQKLISRGSYLNIEPLSIIPEAIRRWHRQDNRNETLKKINLVVNSAIELINQKNEGKIHLDTSEYLRKSLVGIENLKETYATCFQTCARLDVIIDKIKTSLSKKEIDEDDI